MQPNSLNSEHYTSPHPHTWLGQITLVPTLPFDIRPFSVLGLRIAHVDLKTWKLAVTKEMRTSSPNSRNVTKSMLTNQQFIPATGSRPFGALSGNYILHGSPIHTPCCGGLHHATHMPHTMPYTMNIPCCGGYTMPHTPRRPLNAGWKYLAAGQNSHLQQRTRREMRKDQTRRTELGREGSGKGRMEAEFEGTKGHGVEVEWRMAWR